MAGNKRVDDFASWILGCRPSWYNLWLDGPLSDRSPAWAANLPLPTQAEVNVEGLFCAAVGNLGRRYYGLPIPNPHHDENWDGGTLAWYDYYYSNPEVEWFDPNKSYEDGYAFVSQYLSPGSQGHWAMSYEGYCIESIMNGGLVWKYTVRESDEWGRYVLAIPPNVWLGTTAQDPAPGSKVFDVQMLVSAMTSTSFASPDIDPAWAETYHAALLRIFDEYEIDTRERITAFLAQTGHESGGFNWWREFGGADKHYAPYYGRGPMQLTWQGNYQKYENASGYQVVSDPDSVARSTNIGFDSAGFYWRGGTGNGDLNPAADLATWESFDEITRRINGGYNGKADRDARYVHAWNLIPDGVILPTPSAPAPTPEPPPAPAPTPTPEPENPFADFWAGFTGGDDFQWMRAAKGQGGDAPHGSWIRATEVDGRYWLEIVPPDSAAMQEAAPEVGPPEIKAEERVPIDETIEFEGKGEHLELRGNMTIREKQDG